MDWLWGLAIMPALLCGLMCIGGVALAAIGLRRSSSRRAYCDEPASEPSATDELIPVDR